MFDPSLGDFMVMIAMAVLYFHVGRIVGMRVGYLQGRKAVREYYEAKEKVRV
jgi:mannose/fructose/N-acetylgalactosamine-specific phosphotransferase system component IID